MMSMVTLTQNDFTESQYNFEEKAIRKDQWSPISVEMKKSSPIQCNVGSGVQMQTEQHADVS